MGGGGPSPPPKTPDWVVAWIPPTPPLRTLILGPAYLQNRPENGPIFPVFWGLRCKVLGGWGGSAHYPDPTAQSERNCRATRRRTPCPRRDAFRAGPASLCLQNLSKMPLFCFFVVVESCLLREVAEAGCGNSLRECVPRPAGPADASGRAHRLRS